MFSFLLHLMLLFGILISLSIFLKINVFHCSGELLILFTNKINKLTPLKFEHVNVLCILISAVFCIYEMRRFGFFSNYLNNITDSKLHNDPNNQYVAYKLIISSTTFVLWTFLFIYYKKKDRFHTNILNKQKQHEVEFLKTQCIKIK